MPTAATAKVSATNASAAQVPAVETLVHPFQPARRHRRDETEQHDENRSLRADPLLALRGIEGYQPVQHRLDRIHPVNRQGDTRVAVE
jgi:hypothetical protein